MRQLCDGLPPIDTMTTCREVRVAIELMMDTGRRPEETCELPWNCLEPDKDGKYVLATIPEVPASEAGTAHHRHHCGADHRPAAASA